MLNRFALVAMKYAPQWGIPTAFSADVGDRTWHPTVKKAWLSSIRVRLKISSEVTPFLRLNPIRTSRKWKSWSGF